MRGNLTLDDSVYRSLSGSVTNALKVVAGAEGPIPETTRVKVRPIGCNSCNTPPGTTGSIYRFAGEDGSILAIPRLAQPFNPDLGYPKCTPQGCSTTPCSPIGCQPGGAYPAPCDFTAACNVGPANLTPNACGNNLAQRPGWFGPGCGGPIPCGRPGNGNPAYGGGLGLVGENHWPQGGEPMPNIQWQSGFWGNDSNYGVQALQALAAIYSPPQFRQIGPNRAFFYSPYGAALTVGNPNLQPGVQAQAPCSKFAGSMFFQGNNR